MSGAYPGVRIGDEVRVQFYDHVEDGTEAINFTVWGRVSDLTKRTISIECWAYTDPNEEDKNNVKVYTIVKKAISSLVVVAPVLRRKRAR
jgi:hypothetical protein